MNAVICARYSSDEQKKTSIEDQVRDCMSYAMEKGYDVLRVYSDEAKSGKNDNRPQFQQMLADSASGLFQTVIVWKVDRFGRNRHEIAINKVKLKKNGVKVIYAKEPIPEGSTGILMESILEGMAEYYNADFVEKTMRGKVGRAMECRLVGGRPPLGYKVQPDKSYAVDERTAPAVQLIFGMYADGYSMFDIINVLNAKGYQTTRGQPFGKNSLHDLLRNDFYIGTYTFKRTYSVDGEHSHRAENKVENMIRVENGVPAIVDRETWERVQNRMDLRRQKPGAFKAKRCYLLSTKIYCGECGGAMVGITTKSGDHENSYYECNTRKRLRTCKKKNVRLFDIEELVIDEIKASLTDQIIDRIADAAVKISMEECDNSQEIENIVQRIKNVDKVIQNIGNAIAQGIITETTRAMLLQAEDEKKCLELQLKQERVMSGNPIQKEDVVKWLRRFQSCDMQDTKTCQSLIDSLIHKVVVYDDGRVILMINYSGQK